MCNSPGSNGVFGLLLSGVAAFLGASALWGSRAPAQCDPIPGASGPDAVSVIQTGVGVFGCANGIQEYFSEGGVCNVGTDPLRGDLIPYAASIDTFPND